MNETRRSSSTFSDSRCQHHQLVKAVKAILPQLEVNLPASIQVTPLTDLTTAINASVSDVEFELMLTLHSW